MRRPFAAGQLPIAQGVVAIPPACIIAAFGLSLLINPPWFSAVAGQTYYRLHPSPIRCGSSAP